MERLLCWRSLSAAGAAILGQSLGAAVDVKLLIDALDKGGDRPVADFELHANLFVNVSFAKKIQHSALALAECCHSSSRWQALKGLDDFAGNAAGHRRAALYVGV